MPIVERVLCENVSIKFGKIVKRIQFLEDRLGYSIIEQVLEEDRYKPIHKPGVWKTSFFLPSTERNIARTAWIGRLGICAYEENNRDTG